MSASDQNDASVKKTRHSVDMTLLGIAAATLVGFIWMAWSGSEFAAPDTATPSAASGQDRVMAPTVSTNAIGPASIDADVDIGAVQTVVDYIMASAAAAERRDVERMRPFVDVKSAMWRAIEEEYARRARVGERRIATLDRLRVERAFMAENERDVVVQTLEAWSVQAYAYDRVNSFRYVARFQYRVRRVDDRWKVWETQEAPLIIEPRE